MRIIKSTTRGECDPWLAAIGPDIAYFEDGQPFWSPEYSIEFTTGEVAALMAAARSVYALMEQVFERHHLDEAFYESLGIRARAVHSIIQSWQRGDRSLHGRFDFGIDSQGQVRLYEYNTGAVGLQMVSGTGQPIWFEKVSQLGRLAAGATQCACLRHALTCALGKLDRRRPLHIITSADNASVNYSVQALQEAALSAGLKVRRSNLCELRQSANGRCIDGQGKPVYQALHLMLWNEVLGVESACVLPPVWLDPPWAEVLGNKAFLHHVWKAAQDHPNLLPTYTASTLPCFSTPRRLVSKPLRGMAGHGVRIVDSGEVAALDPKLGNTVWQEYAPCTLDGLSLALSVWVVDGVPIESLAVRAAKQDIVDGRSTFLPHSVVAGL